MAEPSLIEDYHAVLRTELPGLLADAVSDGLADAFDKYSTPRAAFGSNSTGVVKKSAMYNRAVRELAGRSLRMSAADARPARTSATCAAGGPAVIIRVTVSVTPSRLSRSNTPPPSPPSISCSCT